MIEPKQLSIQSISVEPNSIHKMIQSNVIQPTAFNRLNSIKRIDSFMNGNSTFLNNAFINSSFKPSTGQASQCSLTRPIINSQYNQHKRFTRSSNHPYRKKGQFYESNNRKRNYDSDTYRCSRNVLSRIKSPPEHRSYNNSHSNLSNSIQNNAQLNIRRHFHSRCNTNAQTNNANQLNQINQIKALPSNVPFYPPPSNPAALLNSSLFVPQSINESFIMFENRTHKIYHFDENMSIILMNCPITLTLHEAKQIDPVELDPRLVWFEGCPINVFIDEKDAVLLSFNNQWKKFYNNGFEQYIRFGTPDREVFLNSQIIKAKFGGAPVTCKLNGSTCDHTIRLDLPTPTLKLSTDSCIQLWYKLIKKLSQPTNPIETIPTPATSQPQQQQKQQCSKIEQAVVITKKPSPIDKYPKSTLKKSRLASNKSPTKSALQDNECTLELEPDSLRIKRPELIEKLYRGLQCTNCSLRFNVDSPEIKLKYPKHLDWHFRKNRKSRNKATSRSRDWYYPLDQWLEFKEINLDFEDDGPRKTKEQRAAELRSKLTYCNLDENQVEKPLEKIKANADDSLNQCSTCFERFHQKWCDDEDAWVLENATTADELYYHPTCLIVNTGKSSIDKDFVDEEMKVDEHRENSICLVSIKDQSEISEPIKENEETKVGDHRENSTCSIKDHSSKSEPIEVEEMQVEEHYENLFNSTNDKLSISESIEDAIVEVIEDAIDQLIDYSVKVDHHQKLTSIEHQPTIRELHEVSIEGVIVEVNVDSVKVEDHHQNLNCPTSIEDQLLTNELIEDILKTNGEELDDASEDKNLIDDHLFSLVSNEPVIGEKSIRSKTLTSFEDLNLRNKTNDADRNKIMLSDHNYCIVVDPSVNCALDCLLDHDYSMCRRSVTDSLGSTNSIDSGPLIDEFSCDDQSMTLKINRTESDVNKLSRIENAQQSNQPVKKSSTDMELSSLRIDSLSPETNLITALNQVPYCSAASFQHNNKESSGLCSIM